MEVTPDEAIANVTWRRPGNVRSPIGGDDCQAIVQDIPPLSLGTCAAHLQLGLGMPDCQNGKICKITSARNRFSQVALMWGMLQILDLRICHIMNQSKGDIWGEVPRTFICLYEYRNFLSQLHLLREHGSEIHKTNIVCSTPEYHCHALPNLDFFYFEAAMLSPALSRGSATWSAAARASKVLQ